MHTTNDCENCRYATFDYDDAYSGKVWFIGGGKRADQGLECVEEVEEEDG